MKLLSSPAWVMHSLRFIKPGLMWAGPGWELASASSGLLTHLTLCLVSSAGPFITTDYICHAEPLRWCLWITKVHSLLSSRFWYVLQHGPIIPSSDAQIAAPSGSQRIRYSAQSSMLCCANRLHRGCVRCWNAFGWVVSTWQFIIEFGHLDLFQLYLADSLLS